MTKSDYHGTFFSCMHQRSVYAAERILGIVTSIVPAVNSAVDVGCGVGTWVRVLEDLGVKDVSGIDAGWVKEEFLQISPKQFLQHDLRLPLMLERKYDLALSCEVAEHLPRSSGEIFIDSLCGLSSFVLFSAAVPGQGGEHHVNEQWPTYWIELFEERGYTAVDAVRKKVWADSKIPFYYRQNMLLFVERHRISELNLQLDVCDTIPPEKYLLTYQRLTRPGVRQSLRSLRESIFRRLFRRQPSTSKVAAMK